MGTNTKTKSRIFAMLMALFIAVTSMPAINAEAAKKYEHTYLKSIKIEAQKQTQEETVKVMKKMTFVISAKKYGNQIDIDDNKANFEFTSSDPKIATVTEDGVVSTLKNGKCDITVKNRNDIVKYVIHLVVRKSVKVSSIKLNKKKLKITDIDKEVKLKAKVKVSTKDAGKIPVAWYSTNEDIAEVDENGNVEFEDYGTCYICCTAGSNGKVAKCKVTVVDSKNSSDNSNVKKKRPEYKTGKVVSLSQYNDVVDWKLLKQKCDAVIIRVGSRGYGASGALIQDTKFADHVYKCNQYGIPYSVYFVTTATSTTEGAQEAEFIASKIKGHNLSFPVFFASKKMTAAGTGRSDKLAPAVRTSTIKQACQTLNSKGIEAGVYSNPDFIRSNLNVGELPYPFWIQQWGNACTYSGDKLLWEYSSGDAGYGVRSNGQDKCIVSNWYKGK